MPWYAVVYATFLVVMVGSSLVLRAQRGLHVVPLLGMALSGASSLTVFIAYFQPDLVQLAGYWLFVPLIFAPAYDALTFDREFQREAEFREIPEEDRSAVSTWSVIFGFLIMAPAWFFGTLAALGQSHPPG